MKKIFTLVLGLVLTVAMFAADRNPSVYLTAPRKYKIMIDGRSYFSNNRDAINITSLNKGFHIVKVYEIKRGFFKMPQLVSTSSFVLKRSDVTVDINHFGQAEISETWSNRWDRGDHDHDYGYSRGRK